MLLSHLKRSFQQIHYLMFGILLLISCQKRISHSEIKRALITSNEIQRKAHLENDAALLVGEIAGDSFIYIANA